MTNKIRKRIQSLDRGLQILEYIAGKHRPVLLQELAGLFGIEKSSAYRLAQTLVDRGYLTQDADTLGYLPDTTIFALANMLAGRRNVQEYSRKYIKKLAQLTGETAHLAVRGKIGAVLVDHAFGTNPVAVTTCWGSTEPYHCTALGKALLAGRGKDELRDILGTTRLHRYTPATTTKLCDVLEQCQTAAKEGIAFDNEEFRVGMSCMASPLYDFRGGIVAAIGISGPTQRVVQLKEILADKVKEIARQLSAELGYTPSAGR